MSKVVEIAENIARPLAEQCGVELVEVVYKKGAYGMELLFYIDTDKDGGISLDDCETMHRLVDPLLDDADPTDGQPYQLSVSSPGLDRPLKLERDYKKNLNKEVNVSLFNKIDIGKKFVAVLKDYDLNKGEITVIYGNSDILVDIKNVANIKPEIKF